MTMRVCILSAHGRQRSTQDDDHAMLTYISTIRDTVSSVGFARGPTLPETTTGMRHVCIFRHALALDELRIKFLPEYANGGRGPHLDNNTADIKEVWFLGSHSDMYVLDIRCQLSN